MEMFKGIKCYRCGSESVSVWLHNGKCRIRCGYCDADTGEQKTTALAERMWSSFKKVEREETSATVRVLTADEVLDSSCYDESDVRPLWFENRGIYCSPVLLRCGLAEREHENVRVLLYDSYGKNSYDMRNYGSWWRCWSDKPSAEQVEDTPWAE